MFVTVLSPLFHRFVTPPPSPDVAKLVDHSVLVLTELAGVPEAGLGPLPGALEHTLVGRVLPEMVGELSVYLRKTRNLPSHPPSLSSGCVPVLSAGVRGGSR